MDATEHAIALLAILPWSRQEYLIGLVIMLAMIKTSL